MQNLKIKVNATAEASFVYKCCETLGMRYFGGVSPRLSDQFIYIRYPHYLTGGDENYFAISNDKEITLAELEALAQKAQMGEGLTLRQKFFDYWVQEHNILILESDFWEMERLFKNSGLNSFETMVEESEAQKRYEAAQKLLDECGFYASGDYSDTAYKALRIAAGLPL